MIGRECTIDHMPSLVFSTEGRDTLAREETHIQDTPSVINNTKDRDKEVSFSSYTEIVNIPVASESLHPQDVSNRPQTKPNGPRKLINIFYSNVSSFSLHAKSYISSLPLEVSALALVELHDTDTCSVRDWFRLQGFSADLSPAEPTPEGTHGGELIAVRSHINSTPVPGEVLQVLQEHAQEPSRFSARIIRLKHLSVLLVAVYLWCSEGPSERNNEILHMIFILKNILGLPIIVLGDFNMLPQELLDSGWTSKLKVSLVESGAATTVSSAADRPIDFGLISNEIHHIFHNAQPILSVPWGPHCGILFRI